MRETLTEQFWLIYECLEVAVCWETIARPLLAMDRALFQVWHLVRQGAVCGWLHTLSHLLVLERVYHTYPTHTTQLSSEKFLGNR